MTVKELTLRNYAWCAAVLLALCSMLWCFDILALLTRPIGPNEYLNALLACRAVTGLLCVAVLVLSEKDKRWQVWSSLALIPMWLIGPILLGGLYIWSAPARSWWSEHEQSLTVVFLVLFVFMLLEYNRPGICLDFLNYLLGRSRRGARTGTRPSSFPTAASETMETASSLVVQQNKDFAEIIPLVEKKNRYLVKTVSGTTLLSLEDTSYATKNWLFRRRRPFTFHASRGAEDTALQFHIPNPSFLSWGDWEMSVTDTAGRLLGKVRSPVFFSSPSMFTIYSAEGQELYGVVGRPWHLWDRWDFAIFRGRLKIGSISNEWGGLAQEMLTTADTYRMTFPHELPVTHKHLLLGALLILDLRCFEGKLR